MLKLKTSFALLALAASAASASAVTFNFEDLAASPTLTSGTYTSVSEASGGVTMTVTRPGSSFDIGDLSSFMPAADNWGSRSLDPFVDNNAGGFLLSFSTSITSFSIQYGDFGQDSDTVSVSAFGSTNGTGSAIVSISNAPWGLENLTTDAPGFLSFSAAGINSVFVTGGSSDFPASMFYDDITVTPSTVATTPEPSTILLLLTGAGGLVGMRRRRST